MGFVDVFIGILYLVCVVGIGIVTGKGKKKSADMFTAGKSMGALTIGLSVMVTAFSSINIMAFPGEVYKHGLYVMIALPMFFVVGIPVTKIVIPWVSKLNLVNIYSWFEERFDAKTSRMMEILFLLWRVVWMSVMLYASGRVLNVTIGISVYAGVIISGVVATLYTAFGGIRTVMITDMLQAVVVVGALGLVTYFGLENVSSGKVFIDSIASAGSLKPFYPFDSKFFSFDPTIRISFWSGIIGVFVAFLARYSCDQVVVQRYLTTNNTAKAVKGYWISAIAAVIAIGFLGITGLVAKSWAVSENLVGKSLPPLKVVALMIADMPPGVAGLFAAALLAATMSSLDSGVNACSAIRYGSKGVSTKRVTMFSILLGMLVIIVALMMVVFLGQHQTIFRMINQVVNGMGTPILALFIVGRYSRFVNADGVFAGGIAGVICSVVIILQVKGIALHYYGVLNLIVTLFFCYIFSALFKAKS